MPLVSVIVTTFNRRELLGITLDSILNQSFQDFEIIVVDNFSNYDFPSIINEYNSNKILTFQNKNNNCIAVNRNFALKHARGKYLAFCDDDDIWEPNKLAKQVDLAMKSEANGSMVLIYSNIELFGDNLPTKVANKKRITSLKQLIWRNQISYSTVFVTHSDHVYFNEDRAIIACEDYELWIRLMHHDYQPVFITDPLIKYRVNGFSVNGNNAYLLHIKSAVVLLKYVIVFGFDKVSLTRIYLKLQIEMIKGVVKYLLARIKLGK